LEVVLAASSVAALHLRQERLETNSHLRQPARVGRGVEVDCVHRGMGPRGEKRETIAKEARETAS